MRSLTPLLLIVETMTCAWSVLDEPDTVRNRQSGASAVVPINPKRLNPAQQVVVREGSGAGKGATIRIGRVEAGPPGAPPSVRNSGTDTAVVLDFVIPGSAGNAGGAAGLDAQDVTAIINQYMRDHAAESRSDSTDLSELRGELAAIRTELAKPRPGGDLGSVRDDIAALTAKVDKLQEVIDVRYTSLDVRLVALEERKPVTETRTSPPPKTSNGELPPKPSNGELPPKIGDGTPLPIQHSSGISHYVLVADRSDSNYQRLVGWVSEARKVHPVIRVVEASQVPFKVTVLPTIVAYGLDGHEVAVEKGTAAVERLLQNISRGDFSYRGPSRTRDTTKLARD